MQMKMRKKGISLVEIILSIAVLSILSVYVIQMFITSNTLNEKAEALDQSVLMSQTIFEAIDSEDSLDSLDALHQLPMFKFAKRYDQEGTRSSEIYFDRDWKTVETLDMALYVLRLDATAIQALEYLKADYQITVLKEENFETETLYEIGMQKYY